MCRVDSLRADDFSDKMGEKNNPEWKTVAFDAKSKDVVAPNGSVGFRWGEQGEWNLEERAGNSATELKMSLVLDTDHDEVVGVDFPYFGGAASSNFVKCEHPDVLTRDLPVKRLKLADGEALVATVFDLFCANYGLDRGLGGEWAAKSYDDDMPYTPAWAEKITGVPRDKIITVAREFALNAEKTQGQVDGHSRGRDQPLVPHGHELSRHHQHAGDVRLRRPVGRWLVALCRAGKAAPANRLAAAGLRAGLEQSATPHELYLCLVCAYRSVALRDGECATRFCRPQHQTAIGMQA